MDNNGFQKIELKKVQIDAVVPQAMNVRGRKISFLGIRKPRNMSRDAFKAFVIFGLLVAIFSIQTVSAFAQAIKMQRQAKIAVDAFKNQNIALARDELVKTRKEIDSLDRQMSGMGYLRFVPLVSFYYSDADHLLNAARHGVDAGIITTDTLIPYADVLGLKGQTSFVGGDAQDRIRLAVKTMSKIVPQIDKIEGQLVLAQKEIDKVNPNHYPPIFKLKAVHNQIKQIQDIADGAVIAAHEGKPLVKSLPDLLGESQEKKYLVLFQNDAELRPTGGFLTYYAIFKVQEGVLSVDSSSDIYELDDNIKKHPDADPIILKYLPKVDKMYIRDTNLSPDFIVSMAKFNELYETVDKKVDVDGIITLDTQFLVNLIRILGGVSAQGINFSADTDERCDCPQVVYALEDQISKPVNFVKSNRKGLLADLMVATLDKALSSSPGEYWGRLFQQFVTDAQEKHVLFYLYNKEAQKGLEALNWSGRVKNFEGDYMYINDANFGGQKSNLFVKKELKIEYNVKKDGEVVKQMSMVYKNPHKPSDCNLESGGLCLNAPLRNYQRFYVPQGSSLLTYKGSEVKVGTKEEFNKTYFDSFFRVNPLGRQEITYTYRLPFKVSKKSTLPLLIQKQPGIDSIPVEIYVNGKKVRDFDLRTDMQLDLKVF